MNAKLEQIKEYLIEKMHSVAKDDKICSTEQLLNFSKTFCAIAEMEKPAEKTDIIIPAAEPDKI